MAKVLATIAGTALAPGVSKNNRLYTREAIARAVQRAQSQLAEGKTLTVLTHHEAGDASDRIIGRITSMSLDENGAARFTADLANTPHARTIASLVDNSGGQPFLTGMSIRGQWLGKVKRVTGPSGTPCETADDLEFAGIDPTHKPGVESAGVDTFAWAKDGTTETTERVLITESVQEAHVTITEEAPAVPDGVREALRYVFGDHVAEAATPAVSKRGSGLNDDGGRQYADPGYQSDKKQRYDISTKAKAKAAWSFVNQPDNAKLYSGQQLKRIKGRIRSALGKFGVTTAAEGWTVDPAVLLTESLLEYYGGDPSCAGSYSLSATNGPTTVTVCSYGCDPADLMVILAQACKGAGMALCALDPDMDADIDLPGEQEESAEDPDALTEEASASDAVTETAPVETPAPEPAAADRETEVPAMSETTTTEAVAPATAAAPAVGIPEDLVLKYQKKLAKQEAARRFAAAGAPAESAPPAPAAAAVTETDDERIARIVEERLAAARTETPAAPPVTETEEQRINRIVEARLVQERQEITAAGGGPSRKGLVTEHSAAGSAGEIPADFPMKDGAILPMEEWTDTQRRAVGSQLEAYVLGGRYPQQ